MNSKNNSTEQEIQTILKMLEDTSPAEATRENAIKVIQQMRTMAGEVVDKIEDDLKTGKVSVDDAGKPSRG
jgi:hypothetical protein